VISKTDLAKYENAWRQLPHTVSLGAQKNFLAFSAYASEAWEKSADEFNEEYFKRMVAKAILFRRAEQLVSNQPWYQGGYRANIVAYTVAKLSRLIESEAPSRALDFRSIWARQALSAPLETFVVKVVEQVFNVIVSPEGGFQNVTEWCKKELCWKRCSELEMVSPGAVFKELIDRDQDVQQKKDSQAHQKIERGIERQALVLQLGPDYWKEVKDWGSREGLLSPDDQSFLAVATAIPRKIPSEKQSFRLMEIKVRLESEGFPVRQVTEGSV